MVVKTKRKGNVPDGEGAVAKQVARLVNSHFNNVLLRGDVEEPLKFPSKLAEGQVAHFGEFRDCDFLPEVIVNMAERFVEFLFGRKLFPVLMIVLNNAHDSEYFVRLGEDWIFTGEEPRGDALAVQEQFHDFCGWLAAFHDGDVVAPVLLRKPSWEQVKIGVANKIIFGFEAVKGDQMPVCGQKHAVAIFREERKTGDTIEKMIKTAGRIDLVEK